MAELPAKLKLPRVRKVELRSFSLYSSAPIITVDIPEGVFCLAGANGLGKSTFLTAVNYAITGIVSDPNRKFESIEEYYQFSLKFADSFFTGRIAERDREAAEVSLDMLVGNRLYKITRGVFDVEELREFSVIETDDVKEEEVVDTSEMTASERHEKYTNRITQDVGFNIFEQLVFLQHFVCTFDERRHLLFWNQRTLEEAIYLAFGVDHAEAKRAGALRRDIEKADSLARNANWQATEVRKKIREMESTFAQNTQSQNNDGDIEKKHEKLLEEYQSDQDAVVLIQNQLRDATLILTEFTARQAALRTEYSEVFSARTQKRMSVEQHPLVITSILEARCGICGSHGDGVVDAIKLRVQEATCPLCGSATHIHQVDPEYMERLKSIDEEISTVKFRVDEVTKTISRLNGQLEQAKSKADATRIQLENFERANNEKIQQLRSRSQGKDNIQRLLDTYRTQLDYHLKRKEEQYARRNTKREELLKLQRNIERQYAVVEEEFVPLFRDLAFRFLGIDLDIKMETGSSPGVNLVLEVRSTARRQYHQLSESQRFFIDIALRMALVQYMSDPVHKASLFIDTPEGSLDIAYESRAGDMFARFIEKGYDILMTANINSSRLLRRLAERCGQSTMYLCRMTSWTDLSEVQIEEEDLFEEAYADIELALKH